MIIAAGVAYFAITFGIGFLLGTFRVLVLVPGLGDIAATALELPFMIAFSWIISQWLIIRFSVPAKLSARLIMGGVAFVLLVSAELALSALMFDRSLTQHLDQYRSLSAILGILGQVAFAAFPAIQLRAYKQQ